MTMKDAWPLYQENNDAGAIFTISRFLGLFCLNKRGEFSKSVAAFTFLPIFLASLLTFTLVMTSLIAHAEDNNPVDSFWSATELVRCLLDIIGVFTNYFRSLSKRNKLKRHYGRIWSPTAVPTGTWAVKMIIAIFVLRSVCFCSQIAYAKTIVNIVDVSASHILAYMYMNNVLIIMQMTTMMDIVTSKFVGFLSISPANYLNTDRHSVTVDFIVYTIELYDLSVLLFTLRALIELTSVGYYCFITFNKALVQQSIWYVLYTMANLITLLTVLFGLMILVRTCEETAEIIEGFYKELFRMMRESKDLCNNKKLCLYLSMKKTVNFTASGFFDIGYPLITSIVAAATTYLVILVQFSKPNM